MWKQNKEKMHETFCKKREEEYICSWLRQQQLLCRENFRRLLIYIYIYIYIYMTFNEAYEVHELASNKLFQC